MHVKAGQSVIVSIPTQHTDFSVVDADGVRVALSGTWTVTFGIAGAHGMGFAEHTIDAV